MAVSLKRRVSLPLVINGCVSSLVLLLGMTPTFASFTASISGQGNSAGAGTIVMQEKNSSGVVTCMSTDGGEALMGTASCSAINKFGGVTAMGPGESVSVVTTIQNVGSLAAASFSLTPGACAQSAVGPSAGSATDLCSKFVVSITSGSSTIFNGSAAALGAGGVIDLLARLGLSAVVPGLNIPVTVTTTMDASVDNSYQGLQVSQPMTWTFSS